MSIKDKISVHPTHRKFTSDFNVDVEVFKESKSVDTHTGFSEIEEHRVDIRLGVFFRCNSVELRMAEARAREQLVHELYKDQRSAAYAALNAVCSGDRREAMNLLDKLIQSMKP